MFVVRFYTSTKRYFIRRLFRTRYISSPVVLSVLPWGESGPLTSALQSYFMTRSSVLSIDVCRELEISPHRSKPFAAEDRCEREDDVAKFCFRTVQKSAQVNILSYRRRVKMGKKCLFLVCFVCSRGCTWRNLCFHVEDSHTLIESKCTRR